MFVNIVLPAHRLRAWSSCNTNTEPKQTVLQPSSVTRCYGILGNLLNLSHSLLTYYFYILGLHARLDNLTYIKPSTVRA